MSNNRPFFTVVATCTALLSTLIAHNASAHEYDALIKAKKYADVERAVASKLSTEPNNPDALIAKTELILIEGKDNRLDEAAKLAEQCINASPNHSECHEALGNVLGTKAQKGGVMSALSYVGKIKDAFKKAVELDPKNYSARFSLMQFYLQAPGFVGGGTGKAKDLIIDTIKLSPAAGALLQANLDLKEDNFERALAGALAVNTNGTEALAKQQRDVLANIGYAYIGEKKYTEAEKIFKEVTQRFPDFSGGYYGLGRTLQERGNPKDALPLLEKSHSMDASGAALYRIGKSWQALGDKSKAIAFYEKALNFKPEISKKAKSDIEDQLKALKG